MDTSHNKKTFARLSYRENTMNYGYFDDLHREYVITNPRTPAKWINYIGTLQFGGFVDHTGGALICKQDPTFNRITKYIQQMPASDFKGETIYLRLPLSQIGRGVRGEDGLRSSPLSSFPHSTPTPSTNVASAWATRAFSVRCTTFARKSPFLFRRDHQLRYAISG